MSAYRSTIAIAVFQRDGDAKNAIDALRNAGFQRDQIGLAWHQGGAANINYLNDLVSLGISQERAQYYDREFHAGHPVVSVRTDGRDQDAYTVLHHFGGYDYDHPQSIDSAQAGTWDSAINVGAPQSSMQEGGVAQPYNAVQQPSSQAQQDVTAQPTVNMLQQENAVQYNNPAQQPYGAVQQENALEQESANREMEALPLRAERLQLGKQMVQTGEVRLRKEIVSEQQNIDVPITREEIVVERHPGSGQVSDTPIGQEETIRIPVYTEHVNVTKIPVEVGEVAISKRTVQENRRVSTTVRHEEPRLETDGNPTVHNALNAEGVSSVGVNEANNPAVDINTSRTAFNNTTAYSDSQPDVTGNPASGRDDAPQNI
jgi:uncharacterized protein (TIGR02271 family)